MLREIYFFDARALAIKLHNAQISEEVAFTHLLIYSVLFASYLTIPITISYDSGITLSWPFEIISFITLATIQFWGMRLIYRTNKIGDGQNFFVRLAVLSLPVSIQLTLIGIVVGVIFGAFAGYVMVSWEDSLPNSVWEISGIIFAALLQFMYFKLFQRNIYVASCGETKEL